MSWEDCGFKPGKIYGPEKCSRTCSDCDGDHHFYIGCEASACLDDDEPRTLPEGLDPECFFVCRHCETYAEAVDDFEGDESEDQDLDNRINELLHDAEHAESGAGMARMMKDADAEKRLKKKAESLLAKAQEMDPSHSAPAWGEHRDWVAK